MNTKWTRAYWGVSYFLENHILWKYSLQYLGIKYYVGNLPSNDSERSVICLHTNTHMHICMKRNKANKANISDC